MLCYLPYRNINNVFDGAGVNTSVEMSKSVQQKTEPEDDESPSLPVQAFKAYFSLGWFDRMGIAAMIIMAGSMLITLIGYAIGVLF